MLMLIVIIAIFFFIIVVVVIIIRRGDATSPSSSSSSSSGELPDADRCIEASVDPSPPSEIPCCCDRNEPADSENFRFTRTVLQRAHASMCTGYGD
jgi:hypothetical protein